MKLSNETREWLLSNRRHGCSALSLIDEQVSAIEAARSALLECQEECAQWPVRAGLRRRICEALAKLEVES